MPDAQKTRLYHLSERLGLLAMVVVLICVICSWFRRSAWSAYWIGHDSEQTTALITKEGGHGVLYYQYTVGQTVYTGSSQSHYQSPYSNVRTGEEAPVYYSTSHPWLSNLTLAGVVPNVIGYAFPFALVGICTALGIVAIVFAPRDRLTRVNAQA